MWGLKKFNLSNIHQIENITSTTAGNLFKKDNKTPKKDQWNLPTYSSKGQITAVVV